MSRGEDAGLLETLAEAQARMAISRAKRETALSEALNVIFGGGTAQDLATEHPIFDDGEFWSPVGGGAEGTHSRPERITLTSLQRARDYSRWLTRENGFAIGAIEARVSYVVGTGLAWRAVPRRAGEVSEEATRAYNRLLEEFLLANDWPTVEQEAVRRSDRDGECFLRAYPAGAAKRPLLVRFVEPEDVRPPDAKASDSPFGVAYNSDDTLTVTGFYVAKGPNSAPVLVPVRQAGLTFDTMWHHKSNVDINQPRGWPTLWPARANLRRVEKLLRNLSQTAAIQAAIALLREHENSTRTEAEAFVGTNRDALVQNTTTGRSENLTHVAGGQILDHGPGISYKAPIMSVDAGKNIPIIAAELREPAAMLNMPEYMFSGDANNANLAATLVSEAPATKHFERMQVGFGSFLRRPVEAAMLHEVARGSLTKSVYEAHVLTPTFPSVVTRNRAEEASKFDVEYRNGVVSIATWRERVGYINEREEERLDQERALAAERSPEPLRPDGGGLAATTGEAPPEAPDLPRADDDEVGVPPGTNL